MAQFASRSRREKSPFEPHLSEIGECGTAGEDVRPPSRVIGRPFAAGHRAKMKENTHTGRRVVRERS